MHGGCRVDVYTVERSQVPACFVYIRGQRVGAYVGVHGASRKSCIMSSRLGSHGANASSTKNRHDWRRDARVCLSSGAAQGTTPPSRGPGWVPVGLVAPRTPGGAAPEPASALSHPTSPHTRACLQHERRHKHPFAVSPCPCTREHLSGHAHIPPYPSIRLPVLTRATLPTPTLTLLRANSRYEIACRSLPPT